jgi:hypothetical protein
MSRPPDIVYGDRFAGQCHFAGGKVGSFDDPHVGRDCVTGFLHDDIAGDHLVRRNEPYMAVAPANETPPCGWLIDLSDKNILMNREKA